jgi:hypothetical protein
MQICLGIVRAELNSIRRALSAELSRIVGIGTYTESLQEVNWEEFFRSSGLLYGASNAEVVVFGTKNEWSLYTCNLADGWYSLFWNLIGRLRCDATFFRSVRDGRLDYQVQEMVVWKDGGIIRQLRALKDDTGWQFLNTGQPLSFERVAQYRRRAIRERLTAELIDDYSASNGFALGNLCELSGKAYTYRRKRGVGSSIP